MTVDEQVGERIHQELWRRRMTNADLARHLGVSESAVSRKLRGTRAWSIEELLTVATVLGVEVADLLPPVMQPFHGAWALAA